MTAPRKDLAADVAIRHVRSARQFLDLQRAFYRGDDNYVPPITSAEAWQLEPAKNPFFGHAQFEAFAAYRGKQCVGRISACVCTDIIETMDCFDRCVACSSIYDYDWFVVQARAFTHGCAVLGPFAYLQIVDRAR